LPTVVIIAGPNGAGKTTFGDEYLSLSTAERTFEFVNADEIARGLDAQGIRARSDIGAARSMLTRVDELVQANADFVVETTLATLAYAQKIPTWRAKGYVVSLAYLSLGSPEEAIMRVRKRVAAGGHSIPEATIHRRFGKSLKYFETIYKPIVDEWYIWESREGTFILVETGNESSHAPRT
jgi:predicted ABC-type ATPase